MAPKSQNQAPPYAKDEKVLCFHGDLMYEAKVMNVQAGESGKVEDTEYHIHYKGWKSSWDDWVTADRMRKLTDDNKQLANQLQAQTRMRITGPKTAKKYGGAKGGAAAGGSEISSARGSEERAAGSSSFAGRGPRRGGRDFELETEDAFHSRPSVKLVIPDVLKALLVDDWENITKNHQLVPLPHPNPVTKIIDEYVEHEKQDRPENSAHRDILEESMAGIKEYFDKCLARILLYRFERLQHAEVRQKWLSNDPQWENRTCPSDTYGAEHLMRLLVSLPELIAQTNMDQQSVNRLREELTKFTNWIMKKAGDYFVNEYETPSGDYSEKARG